MSFAAQVYYYEAILTFLGRKSVSGYNANRANPESTLFAYRNFYGKSGGGGGGGEGQRGRGRMVRWCWVNFQCRGVLLILIIVGRGPTALTVCAGGGCSDIVLSSIISFFFYPLSGRRPDIH